MVAMALPTLKRIHSVCHHYSLVDTSSAHFSDCGIKPWDSTWTACQVPLTPGVWKVSPPRVSQLPLYLISSC